MTLTRKRKSRIGRQPRISLNWSNFLSDRLLQNPHVNAFVKYGIYTSTISKVSYGVTYYQESESMLWGSWETTFSPIQECLTSLPSVIELIAVMASYCFVNGLTSNIFSLNEPDYRLTLFSVLQET